MKDIYYHIDTEKLTGEKVFDYCLEGWVYAPDESEIVLSASDAGGKELPCETVRLPRKDVLQALEKHGAHPKEDPGVRIQIRLEKSFFRKGNEVIVTARSGGWEHVIFRRKAGILARHFFSIRYSVDNWMEMSGKYRITGWTYCRLTGGSSVTVLDHRNREIPAQVIRRRRVDVENALALEGKHQLGFLILIDTDDLEDPRISLKFEAGRQQAVQKIDLSKVCSPGGAEAFLSRIRTRSAWGEFFGIFRNDGAEQAFRFLFQGYPSRASEYQKWFLRHRVKPEELRRQRQTGFRVRPKISITIPLYNTRPEFLGALLDSVVGQSYQNWELCLADGSTTDRTGEYIEKHYGSEPRIHYSRLKENLGIAGNTNAALAMATGDYVMFCDHDDMLEKDALFEIASVIEKDPATDMIYTDEDLTNEKGTRFYSPRFKPDYNPDFLASINYICHIFVVRREIIQKTGGFRKEYDGAQDWDLILRCTELSDRIRHVPKILYHWRAHRDSTAGNQDSKKYAIDNAKAALQAHFERIGEKAALDYTGTFILYQAHPEVIGSPKVSVVICNKDQRDTLKNCVDSIYEKTTWKNFEIIIVENNSTGREIFDYYEELEQEHDNLHVVRFSGPFNYSKVNNFGAKYAEGDYLLLLNNDTRVITPDWMERMLGFCQRDNTGAVGVKLLYGDDTVQHCGVVIGVGGFAGHVLTGENGEDPGEFGRLQAIQDVSAVTGACMMIKKTVFDAVHGLDEGLTVALNDVDLCLKIRQMGLRIVLDPSVMLYHYESKSRGYEETSEKHERFKKEIRVFRKKWAGEIEAGDPYYNPNLTLMYGDMRIRGENEHFDIIDEILKEDAENASSSGTGDESEQ